ncbi:hypothetical protein ACIRJO_03005 [Streptomyces sp. NPDC102394]|uniref:hypothetical protein n=1 Tax=Streptomyces sp. NPDC102394 TaxID=3366167 RepID=UPI003807EFAD
MNATASPPACADRPPTRPAYEPRLGETVRDTGRNKIGKVMGSVGPYVQLRPIDGGVEWDASPDDLEPVPVTEALRASVAAANARSRGESP